MFFIVFTYGLLVLLAICYLIADIINPESEEEEIDEYDDDRNDFDYDEE